MTRAKKIYSAILIVLIITALLFLFWPTKEKLVPPPEWCFYSSFPSTSEFNETLQPENILIKLQRGRVDVYVKCERLWEARGML